MADRGWYLLIHQLPERPLYLRARVRRALAASGALPLKNSVYAMPARPELLAVLEGIARVVALGGGEAYVCEADFVPAAREHAIAEAFRRDRALLWEALAASLRAASPDPVSLRRGRRRVDALRAIDWFDAPGRGDAEAALAALERDAGRGTRGLRGLVWVTRRGVQVDRIATAWLVRRFVDPRARFRFVDPHQHAPGPGEVRFDMAEGEFTHEGDRCTFETLLRRTGVRDAALSRVAEVVHDVDIGDGKFGRAEAAGVKRLLQGLARAHAEDEVRLERGFALLDDLYRSFQAPSGRRA